MAMQMMDTSYKPDGLLGALFSGMNSASAEEDQKQNLIREFLANQRESQAQPFDQMGKQYEGMLAQAKTNDHNYIPWALKGQMGQMMTHDAAGRGKQATYANDVALANQTSQHAIDRGGLLSKVDELQKQFASGGGSMGFPMAPQQPAGGGVGFQMQPPSKPHAGGRTGGFEWQVPPQVQAHQDQVANGVIASEYTTREKRVDALREINRALATKGLEPTQRAMLLREKAGIESSGTNSEVVPQQPEQLAANTPDMDQYEKLMALLVDTPEHRAKLAQGKEKTDSMERIATERHTALLEAARLKALNDKHDTMSQYRAAQYKIASDPNASAEARAQAKNVLSNMSEDELAKQAAAWKPSMNLGEMGVPMNPSPVEKAKASNGTPAAAYELGKAKDGTPVRRKPGGKWESY